MCFSNVQTHSTDRLLSMSWATALKTEARPPLCSADSSRWQGADDGCGRGLTKAASCTLACTFFSSSKFSCCSCLACFLNFFCCCFVFPLTTASFHGAVFHGAVAMAARELSNRNCECSWYSVSSVWCSFLCLVLQLGLRYLCSRTGGLHGDRKCSRGLALSSTTGCLCLSRRQERDRERACGEVRRCLLRCRAGLRVLERRGG
mmetsp:Transcript_7055/g.19975  ORF Transcript_7055/g.19975 Transcript_7055/m.19975 type:complete len:204 (-) Transcript_7055:768-1379(-)